MDILRAGTRPTKKASSEYFTGTVWQDPIVEAPEPARVPTVIALVKCPQFFYI